MDVSALLFDMDDVLYDATVWRRWLLRLLGHLGLHTHYEAFFHVWERTYLCDVYRGERDYWDAFGRFLRAVGLTAGQINEVTAASNARRREFDRGLRAFPGVPSTIARLSAAGMPLGILCNSSCSTRELQQRLTHLGLNSHFRFVLSSRDLHLLMPQPESYTEALRRFSLPAESVAYVSHDAIELGGAAKAGMIRVAFNQRPDFECEFQIEQFEDLLSVTDAPRKPHLAAG